MSLIILNSAMQTQRETVNYHPSETDNRPPKIRSQARILTDTRPLNTDTNTHTRQKSEAADERLGFQWLNFIPDGFMCPDSNWEFHYRKPLLCERQPQVIHPIRV